MKLYGLIGKPLGHSFSRGYFNERFRENGMDCLYVNYELESIDELMPLLTGEKRLMGLNVTSPYKHEVMSFLSHLSPEARDAGAANVIGIRRDEEGNLLSLYGFNTDILGFRDNIAPLVQPLREKRALVCGTGGAAKAVECALRQLGIKTLFASRKESGEDVLEYSRITPEIISSMPLIINATPLGLHPDDTRSVELPYAAITPHHVCVDLIYNPPVTPFLRKCMQKGATVKNGLGMLLGQAEAAWEIWHL